jgi:hypothetical protein
LAVVVLEFVAQTYQNLRHDDTLGGLPLLRRLDGLHHPVEGKAVGDEFFEWESPTLVAEEFQCLCHVPVLASPGTVELELLPRDVMGIDGSSPASP